MILYVTLTWHFFTCSEETEKGRLAGTKENIFRKYSDEFSCHLNATNFLIIHLLPQLWLLPAHQELLSDLRYSMCWVCVNNLSNWCTWIKVMLCSALRMVINNWKGPAPPEVSHHKGHLYLMTYTWSKVVSKHNWAWEFFLFYEVEPTILIVRRFGMFAFDTCIT